MITPVSSNHPLPLFIVFVTGDKNFFDFVYFLLLQAIVSGIIARLTICIAILFCREDSFMLNFFFLLRNALLLIIDNLCLGFLFKPINFFLSTSRNTFNPKMVFRKF